MLNPRETGVYESSPHGELFYYSLQHRFRCQRSSLPRVICVEVVCYDIQLGKEVSEREFHVYVVEGMFGCVTAVTLPYKSADVIANVWYHRV